jgi:hypothetical protein
MVEASDRACGAIENGGHRGVGVATTMPAQRPMATGDPTRRDRRLSNLIQRPAGEIFSSPGRKFAPFSANRPASRVF